MGKGRFFKSMKNMSYGILYNILSLVLSFVSRTIFINTLGVEMLGINGLFTDVLNILSMADLGLGITMAYSYYEPLARGDKDRLCALTAFYRKIYNMIALVVAVLGVILIPFLKYIVNLETDNPYIYVYYLMFLANTVVSYLFVYKSSIINADQKSYLISKYHIIMGISRIGAQCILLYLTKRYMVYLSINLAATVISNLLISNKAEKLYPYIKEKGKRLDKESRKSIFDNIKSVILYKFAMVIFGAADSSIISMLLGTVFVGLYSNYNMIIGAINGLINIVYQSVQASIGNVITSEKDEKRYQIYRYLQKYSFIAATLIAVCLFALIDDAIKVWIGEEFVIDKLSVFAIVLNFYICIILHPIWTFRETTGLYKEVKYIMLLATVVNIILSVLLGRIMGLAGVLFASVIARLSTYFWYEPRLLFKKFFKASTRTLYLQILKNVIISAVIGFAVCFVGGYIKANSWLMLVIKAAAVFVLCLVLVIVAYIKDNDIQEVVKTYIKR